MPQPTKMYNLAWPTIRQVKSGPSKPALRGFTLIEMLVSIAVLALALSIVGVVFTVTTRTASQAAAYSETLNWVRQFTWQLEEDLSAAAPSESILVLVGRTQAASLTEEDLVANRYHRVLTGDPNNVPANYDPEFNPGLDPNGEYSNPRADLLMFLSQRRSLSQAPRADGADSFSGLPSEPVLVAYGHAALADPVWDGSTYDIGVPEHIYANGLSSIPASQWHLARRATIIKKGLTGIDTFDTAQFDRIVPCHTFATGLNADVVGQVNPFDLAYYLDQFESSGLPYEQVADTPVVLAHRAPYVAYSDWANVERLIDGVLYHPNSPPAVRHFATVLRDVPVNLRSNLGNHMLPGCAWFEVEFLMPEDVRNSREYLWDPRAPEGGDPYRGFSSQTPWDMPLWTSVEAEQTYVFAPDSPENRSAVANSTARLNDFNWLDPGADDAQNQRRVRLWPYAIRVTVHVYDQRGQLEQPIIRSIVHRFD